MVFLKRINRLNKKLLWVTEEKIKKILSFPSYLFIFLLKSSKLGRKVKFTPVISGRIGHLAGNTELFLRRLNAGYFNNGYKYVGVAGKSCNKQLLRMFKRQMPIIKSRLLRGIITTPLFQSSHFFQDIPCDFNEYYEFNNLPKVIKFTPDEEKRGLRELKKMGIGPKDWFVCFHNRDSVYLDQQFGFKDWSYHDYRDCKISNFIPAMEYITSLGGYAIRMGHHMKEKLDINHNPKIIDYASNFHSDFMDIYLIAKCKFFVGCTAGLHLVATIFKVPTVGTNFTHLEIPLYQKGDLFLPKKLWDKREKKFMKFKEIFDRRIGTWLHSHQFDDEGLKVMENSPDEILDVTIEMNSILDKSYGYTDEDNFLQKRYWSFVKPHHRCYGSPARIGRDFLFQNKSLLE